MVGSAPSRFNLAGQEIMTPEIDMGSKKVGPTRACFVIAEAGVNHNGSLDMALQMVDAAAKAGADAIKFQTFKAHKVASIDAPKAGYQLRTTDPNESQQKMLKRIELRDSDYREIKKRCERKGIMFLSTPYDIQSLDLLVKMGVSAIKISSTDLTNPILLENASKTALPIICSTGMADMFEVRSAVETMQGAGCNQLALLHCVSGYPADVSTVNLKAMHSMAREFSIPVGYSDHTMGIEVPIAAAALGACIIEKHFTLDRKMSGPDHEASCEPDELASMCKAIRNVQSAIGDGTKKPTAIELANRKKVRRSLAAAKSLEAGTVLTTEMLTALRPGTGISPMEINEVIGRTLSTPLDACELLAWEDLE